MGYYTGCDAHTNSCYFQHMDEDGSLGLTDRVPTDKVGIDRFLSQLDKPTVMVLEAGRNWWWLSQYFKGHRMVSKVEIIDPRRGRKIASELSVQSGYGRAKNDRIDAEMCAEMSRRKIAPLIYPPTEEQLERRSINRFRQSLVWDRSAHKSYIHALEAFYNFKLNMKELQISPTSTIEKLDKSINSYVRMMLKETATQIISLNTSINECEKLLCKLFPKNSFDIKILRSHPGIDTVLARTILSEILDIRNFKDHPKYLVSYSGLAPFESESDGKKGIIKLNRHCNYYLKYAFMEAGHLARTHPRYKRKYDVDVKKHGKVRAKINLARRITKAVYWMLTRQELFRY